MNKLMLGDCLRRMKEIDTDSVDLIYLDPPFNTGNVWLAETGKFAAEFDDRWESLQHYLGLMHERLNACRRVLKPTGSIYLHCDHHASHYLKVRMDLVFGINNFRNDITLKRTSSLSDSRSFRHISESILFYSGKARINSDANGVVQRKGHLKDYPGYIPTDIWHDIRRPKDMEKVNYPAQKPLALLRRILKASSNEGDLVLDPFCGSGTACVAAKQLNRKYIGIDQSKDALRITQRRLRRTKRPMF